MTPNPTEARLALLRTAVATKTAYWNAAVALEQAINPMTGYTMSQEVQADTAIATIAAEGKEPEDIDDEDLVWFMRMIAPDEVTT